ncbi:MULTISPECIES: glutamate 5-kinase [Burkholderiaceae]|uniref:glutamate 5-kinase n=1 Tax=Burkholderiaceae TaxID=119060 RepID=UPI00095F55F8|nr:MULTISPECIES: glutamate 5-kinase [Burkholderiaceae]MCF2132841.1 glutamate 5-kinase [Mycetohabitans sp. B3]MCG1017484.1 glutamate 5-kinase [Mycetohabitans sp. B4]SIT69229.1 glutamate 5-kinase [Burkholderia sp. b13]
MRSIIADAKRLVVKVGSSLVTNDGRGLDHDAIGRWAAQIATLRQQGKDVVLVSSGAIAEGMQRLGWNRRPREIAELQAAAAVGQMRLAQVYESRFAEYSIRTAQILLTHADLADRERYLNARSTLLTLLRLGVVPIINENDTVVTDEIKFGDNDTLGALVANLIEGDVLVILTDQRGLYTADPRKDPAATLVQQADAGDSALEAMAGGTGTSIGRGGMLTKILAAKRAAHSGADTVIASGREPDVLVRLAAAESIGTQLIARTARMAARKQWMADQLQVRGHVVIDAGAVEKLTSGGKSLLPIGIVDVQGIFARGEVIACLDEAGREVARGLTNYSSVEARLIRRHPSAQIESILGYMLEPELIHRDNLVML